MAAMDGGLARLFRANIPDAHWQRIEAEGMGRGIPDVNYCLDGHEGWIEFKQTKGWTVSLRPEQIAWLMRRSRAGGRVIVAVRQRNGGDKLWLLDGAKARAIKEYGLSSNPMDDYAWELLCTSGGPKEWDWHHIRQILTA